MKIFYTLTAALLLNFANAQVNLFSNLKVCMPLNGNANDLSGNGNNGVISGSVTPTSDRFNNSNSAYQFVGGLNDYIAINTFSNVALSNELSFCIWAKADLNTSTCLFMLNPDNSSDRCVACAEYSGVGLIWDYGDIGNQGRITKSTTFDTNWHHYVYTVSQAGNKKEIYMDGTLIITSAYGSSLVNKNFPLYLGAGTSSGGGGSLRWYGKMDDIMIYNRALNASEVSALYTSTITCSQNLTGLEDLKDGLKRDYFYPSISSTGDFNFTGNLNVLQSLQIYTIDGKLVQDINTQLNAKNIDLNKLSNGLYLIKTMRNGEVSFQKICVAKEN